MAEIMDEIDKIAEQLYDAACAARSKDGKSPREIGGPYEKLWPQPKEHYRAMAKWVLPIKEALDVALAEVKRSHKVIIDKESNP
jgi:hypothetical protein